jgi:predicted RNA-binding Zn-ribbon protein involved in translation (DUF1610 family)
MEVSPMPPTHKCPRCGSVEIVRSHRRPWERILFFLKPYRCNSCQRRYFSFALPSLNDRAL